MRILEIISKQTSLDAGYLYRFARSANYRYKIYSIPKRNGGERLIEHPSKKLKFIQRWLAKKLFSKFPVHEKAYAYKSNTNIRHHAELHRGKNYLLRIDFRDFFPSLTAQDIGTILQRFQYNDEAGLSNDEIDFILRIVTRHKKLTIGAPSSPIISNILMYEFDTYWSAYAQERNILYSRYADDVYFSTNQSNILNQCLVDLREYLKNQESPRLYINNEKIVHTSKKRRRIVTGLYLTSDNRVSLGRKKKRKIKSLVHRYMNDNLPREGIDYLSGVLAHAHSVEPSFIQSLKRKYGEDIVNHLMNKQEEGAR